MPAKGKKKKGISLTPEKKKLLKQLIMQKAAEELKKQQELEAAEKKKIIDAKVPQLQIDGLDKSGLEKKVKELYTLVCHLEEEKYDWENKLGRQTEEINELNIKVNDIKGKFSKPMLKKVSKAQQKLAKFDFEAMKKKRAQISTQLKSTGPKYALEEEEKEQKPDWGADQLKPQTSVEEPEEPAEEEEEEEEEE